MTVDHDTLNQIRQGVEQLVAYVDELSFTTLIALAVVVWYGRHHLCPDGFRRNANKLCIGFFVIAFILRFIGNQDLEILQYVELAARLWLVSQILFGLFALVMLLMNFVYAAWRRASFKTRKWWKEFCERRRESSERRREERRRRNAPPPHQPIPLEDRRRTAMERAQHDYEMNLQLIGTSLNDPNEREAAEQLAKRRLLTQLRDVMQWN